MGWFARRPARRAGAVGVVLLLAAAAGCGGKSRADVTGTVTYRGRPVVSGSVVVIASDQMPYYGTIQTDGSFTVRQVPVGPVRLGVHSPDPYYEPPAPPEVKADLEARRQKAGIELPPKPPKGAWFKIPSRYGEPSQSGLTGEVKAPACTINCSLQ